MSLFDRQPDRPKERIPKKTKNTTYNLSRSKNKKGHGENPAHPKVSRDERRRVTELYERGEIIFEDTSDKFLLCHCRLSPDYHSYPHSPHTDELATFELQHYGKSRR